MECGNSVFSGEKHGKLFYFVTCEKINLFCWAFFEIGNDYAILGNLSVVQNYLNLLFFRGEIIEEQKKRMLPKFSQIQKAHGLPKIHKNFDTLSSFLPIVDTTNVPSYVIFQFLAKLLKPLTQKNWKIEKIPVELFDQGYIYFSFDMTSFFTNISLSKTISVVIDRVHKYNIIETKLKRAY